MGRRWIEFRDKNGVYQSKINGWDNDGPALYYRNLSFNATGSILDAIGRIQVDLPMSEARNQVPQTGTHMLVFDSDYGNKDEIAHGIVLSKSEQVSGDGNWGTFVAEDLLAEHRRVTATSGYVTPPINGETLLTTVNRLANMRFFVFDPTAAPWYVTCDITTLDFIDFTAYGVSAFQALDKLRQERAAHFKRGPGRWLKFGRFLTADGNYTPTGLVASKPLPGSQWTDLNPDFLLIDPTSFVRATDGTYVNDMVVFGAGNGDTQLSLEPAYYAQINPTPISPNPNWLNPNYPIQRRPRLDAGGDDTYEYYIRDLNSINTHGLSMGTNNKQGIGVIGTSEGEYQDASVSLYTAGLADLIWNSNPAYTYTFRTLAKGDPRDMAGKTIRVKWYEMTKDGQIDWVLNDDLYVLALDCQEQSDGTMYWVWTLNTQARWDGQNSASTITGALDTINQLSNQPMIYPSRQWIGPIEKDIAATDSTGQPVTFDISLPPDLSQFKMREAVFTVTPIRMYSTATTAIGGQHSHTFTMPNLSTPTFQTAADHGHTTTTTGHADHNVSVPGHNHAGSTTSGSNVSGGTTTNAAGSTATAFNLHYHTLPVVYGGDVIADNSQKGTGVLFMGHNGDNTSINAIRQSGALKVGSGQGYGPSNLSDHSHTLSGSSAGTQGIGTDGSINKNAGIGGALIAAPTSQTQGFYQTATSTNQTLVSTSSADPGHTHTLVYGIFQGPLPTGLTLWVDGLQITQPSDAAFSVDLITWLNDQNAHVVTIKAASLGRVQVVGNIRRQESTIRVSIAG
jgi:hypothetical protein